MSGGNADDSAPQPQFGAPPDPRGPPTEAEEIQHRLRTPGKEDESEPDVDEESVKVQKEKVSAPEVVLEKAKQDP